jgi:hypothetical protein
VAWTLWRYELQCGTDAHSQPVDVFARPSYPPSSAFGAGLHTRPNGPVQAQNGAVQATPPIINWSLMQTGPFQSNCPIPAQFPLNGAVPYSRERPSSHSGERPRSADPIPANGH